MPDPKHPKPQGCRSSACANASLQAEIERLRQMTVEERILAALGMKAKFASLQPVPIDGQPHEPS